MRLVILTLGFSKEEAHCGTAAPAAHLHGIHIQNNGLHSSFQDSERKTECAKRYGL